MALKTICQCDWEDCKLYLEQPITLPCGYTICSIHLKTNEEENTLNGKFKCKLCNSVDDHVIPSGGFQINKKIELLLEQNSHMFGLQREAKILFEQLGTILDDFEKICDMNPHEYISTHFEKIRVQIESKRDVSINLIKTRAERYLNKLKDLEEDCKSNAYKLNKIELDSIKTNQMPEWKNQLRQIDFNLDDIKLLSAKINAIAFDFKSKIHKYKSDLLLNKHIHFESHEIAKPFGELLITNKNVTTDDFGVCIRTFSGHLNTIYCMVVDEKSNRLISCSGDRTIKIWNLNTGECIKTLYGHSESVKCILLTTGNRLVSGSLDNTIRVWDMDRYEWLYNLAEYSNIHCVCLIADEHKFANGCGNGFISIWNLNTLIKEKSFKAHEKAVSHLKLFNEFELISSSGDSIKIWNINLNECIRQLNGHTKLISDLDVNSQDLISCSLDKTIKVWNVLDGKCKETIDQNNEIYRLKILSKNLIAYSNSVDKIYVYDLIRKEVVEELVGHKSYATFLTCLKDGRLLSSSNDNSIKLWKI